MGLVSIIIPRSEPDASLLEAMASAPDQIHSAARLDPVKRPMLLPQVASALLKRQRNEDFRFTVAGDGPEEAALRSAVHRSRMDHLFEYCGHMSDLAPVVADSALLVITSRSEGIHWCF